MRWLYSSFEQTIVWYSKSASRITVGAAASCAVVGMVEDVQRLVMSFSEQTLAGTHHPRVSALWGPVHQRRLSVGSSL